MRLIAIALMFWGGIFMITRQGRVYDIVEALGLFSVFGFAGLFLWEYIRSPREDRTVSRL